jgi:hypothetical protein
MESLSCGRLTKERGLFRGSIKLSRNKDHPKTAMVGTDCNSWDRFERARLHRLQKNSFQLGFPNALYQGMTSVVPQVPQNQCGLQPLRGAFAGWIFLPIRFTKHRLAACGESQVLKGHDFRRAANG